MNNLDYVAIDTETTGLKPGWHEIASIGAVAYNCRTLEPYPESEGGTFYSLMRPQHFDRIQDQALATNKLTREQLAEAPEAKVVWNNFLTWMQRWNKKKGVMTAPIAIMKNGKAFDEPFIQHANELYSKKKEKTFLYHKKKFIEVEDLLFPWFENSDAIENIKLDTLRTYFGMATEGAHSALVDARQTGDIAMHFLKLTRELLLKTVKDGQRLVQLKGCLRGH